MTLARFGIPTDQSATQPRLCSSSHVVVPTTRYNPTGPAGPPVLSHPPDVKPSNALTRILVLFAQGPSNSLTRIPVSSKGEPLNAGLSSNSHGVLRPFDAQPERVHLTPVYLTGYVPPTGFLTLSAAYSSLERPALFHAGNVLGVLLSRGFPSQPGPAAHRHKITLSAFLRHIRNR